MYSQSVRSQPVRTAQCSWKDRSSSEIQPPQQLIGPGSLKRKKEKREYVLGIKRQYLLTSFDDIIRKQCKSKTTGVNGSSNLSVYKNLCLRVFFSLNSFLKYCHRFLAILACSHREVTTPPQHHVLLVLFFCGKLPGNKVANKKLRNNHTLLFWPLENAVVVSETFPAWDKQSHFFLCYCLFQSSCVNFPKIKIKSDEPL